ncbi:hypothetical protein KAW18_17935 [candidate division WOR-3 bacterium]|nr:hypothetical protein [candidate division WOR-3 bacterium]
MTKEITKARILQEIEDKFKLREWIPDKFTFSEEVIPVYNIEPHLQKWEVEDTTVSITSASGFTFFTVPQTERWLLRGYNVIYGMTGAIKGSGLFIDHRPTDNTHYIYLDLVKGQEVSYILNLPVPVVLEPGNRVRYLIDTYVSTQDLSIFIDVQKEELR